MITHCEAETIAFGQAWGRQLLPNTVICFFGDLGAGKTTLIKGIASGVCDCVLDEISSPTFVYLNVYGNQKKVYHFDLYRLRDAEEFYAMGFDEYFEAGGVACIEWSERLGTQLPPHRFEIYLKHLDEKAREITIVEKKVI